MPIYEFVLPIENLYLKTRFFIVGNTKFFKLSSNKRREYIQLHEKISSLKELIEDQFKIGGTYASIKVDATNKEEGYKKAIEEIDTSLNIFKLYRYPNDDFYRRYFGIKGEVIPTDTRVILYKEILGGIGSYTKVEKTGFSYQYTLDKTRIAYMMNNGFGKIHQMLRNQRTKLDNRIISAINWYGKSFNSYTSNKDIIPQKDKFFEVERFIYCIIALESLLIFDREPIRSNLARRVAHLCELQYDKEKVSKTVKNLYDIRSDIIHDGIKSVSKNDLNKLLLITSATIISLVKRRNRLKINTIEDLREWLSKRDLR